MNSSDTDKDPTLEGDVCVSACSKIACQIQKCLALNNHMHNRCTDIARQWDECCRQVKILHKSKEITSTHKKWMEDSRYCVPCATCYWRGMNSGCERYFLSVIVNQWPTILRIWGLLLILYSHIFRFSAAQHCVVAYDTLLACTGV